MYTYIQYIDDRIPLNKRLCKDQLHKDLQIIIYLFEKYITKKVKSNKCA